MEPPADEPTGAVGVFTPAPRLVQSEPTFSFDPSTSRER